jgi:hypothetical protein
MGIEIRDHGEVRKFDAGEILLARGDRVLIDAAGKLSYEVVYGAPCSCRLPAYAHGSADLSK